MTAPATRAVAAPRTVTLALVAAVVVATALVLLSAPVVLRSVVAFPVLALIAGHSATGLLFGDGKADDSAETEPVLRLVLPVLFGLLSLLVVVLLLAVLRIPIATTGVAAGTGVAALLLLLADRRTTLLTAATPVPAPRAPQLGVLARRAAGPALAIVVVAAAAAGAVALRPAPEQQYAQLAFDEPGVVTGQPLSARPGERVVLRWMVSGYGSALPAAEPAVAVRVGGKPASGVSAVVGAREAGTARGVVDDRRGMVTFTAPSATGLYDVEVVVGSDTASTLTVRLAVKP
ncbi:hypothetical protein [Amycolatopsis sp. H20-H5]|uniref:hypothetical protein n=1 Tax=Amycolatopsis sp. H20-H5 TaxID=3046309 RepID=UPI002DC053D2|nr:hypothetical protein [Amycolatopsis sp. H20-H5]MEC3982636.1 hypothetical protein [Amycolatopsis sp. H20-H5]